MLQSEIGNEKGIERRAYERILARCPIKFKSERENALDEGSTRDLSDQGLGFFTRLSLKPEMPLEIWIQLAPQLKSLHLSGKVVWAERQHPGLWRAGVCFTELAFVRLIKTLVNKNFK